MYLQEIVEVAIGLIFVWLVISITTMQIQEWITTNILKWRANDLETAIGNMLSDPEKVKELYAHPLIQSLFEKPGKKPSYIPSTNFSAALFDIVIKAGTEDSPIQISLKSLRDQMDALRQKDPKAMEEASAKLDEVYKKLAHLASKSDLTEDARTVIKASINSQLEKISQVEGISEEAIKNLKSLVNEYKDELGYLLKEKVFIEKLRRGAVTLALDTSEKGQLGKSINSLLAGVEDYATETDRALSIGKKNVEAWFDSTMERLNGWYKRKSQVVALIIGLFLAVFLNVDSVAIAKHLWREPAVRQALAATADKYIEENPNIKTEDGKTSPEQAIEEFQKRFDGLNIPIGWDVVEVWTANDIGKSLQNFKIGNVDLMVNTGSPFAQYVCPPSSKEPYNPANVQIGNICLRITNWPVDGPSSFLKFLGISFTALAAMQGAPFWFDILKKIVNVRSSGANPAEKPKEGTSDKER